MESIDGPQPGWTGRLLAAYLDDHRDLPWRRSRDPYAIYVSEIMLQQTQVQTVIPYYERFMARFPDAAALAAADEDELHRYWAGLGYYARARQMQRAAVQMVERHGGRLPEDPELLLQLPGVGSYTVGAIRSIAFGHAEPAVDGNVVRVIARLYARPLVQGNVAHRAQVAALLQPQIPADRPGDFNQALMELGARICVPSRPRCPQCPVRDDCQAYREGRTGELPLKQPRKSVPEESLTLVVLQLGPWFHVERRSSTLLKGLYQFDLLPGRMDESGVMAWLSGFLKLEAFQAAAGKTDESGVRNPAGADEAGVRNPAGEHMPGPAKITIEPLPDRCHRFTHRLWNLSGCWCRIELPDGMDREAAARHLHPDGDEGAAKAGKPAVPVLVSAAELAALPFPTALAAYRSDVLASESCNDRP